MGISTSTGTLTAGNSRTFNLSPASAVTLTLSPNVRVTITETPATVAATGLGGNASRVHEPRLPGTFTYGPYAMGGVVVVAVASNSGSSVAWTRKDTVVTTSADGTSLVSGDGTVISTAPALMTLAMSGATAEDAGLASGLVNTSQQMGGALGLALLVTMSTTRTDSRLADGASQAAALTDGFQLAFAIGAGLVLAGVVLAVTVLKKPEQMPQEADTRDARDVNAREHEGQPAYEGA